MVFVDPPFRKGLLEETLSLLEKNGWLADDALIYVESEVENGLPPVPVHWDLHREEALLGQAGLSSASPSGTRRIRCQH